MPAEPAGAGKLDQVGREIIGIDRTEAKARRGNRLQQPANEGREGLSAVAAESTEVDAGQHDLAVALGDGSLRSFYQEAFILTERCAACAPDDAVSAAMVATVLHLEEEAGAGEARRSLCGRREIGGNVV